MLNLQVSKSEMYIMNVNYFSRFIRFKCHYNNIWIILTVKNDILVSCYYGWSTGSYIDVMMYSIKCYALLVDHVFLNSVFCSFSPSYLNYRHPDFI